MINRLSIPNKYYKKCLNQESFQRAKTENTVAIFIPAGVEIKLNERGTLRSVLLKNTNFIPVPFVLFPKSLKMSVAFVVFDNNCRLTKDFPWFSSLIRTAHLQGITFYLYSAAELAICEIRIRGR